MDCACDETLWHLAKKGQLTVVGNCSALGNFDPSCGVTLQPCLPELDCLRPGGCRGVATARSHGLLAPLRLAECPDDLPYIIEYKYLIVDPSGIVWWEEDFGEFEPLPRFGGGDEAELPPCKPRRKEKLTRRFQRPLKHSLLMRRDRCTATPVCTMGSTALHAAWRIAEGWDPMIAGRCAEVGPLLKSLGTCAPPGLPDPAGEGTAIALDVFVRARRSRLEGCLAQLARRRHLPPDLWFVVGEFVGFKKAP